MRSAKEAWAAPLRGLLAALLMTLATPNPTLAAPQTVAPSASAPAGDSALAAPGWMRTLPLVRLGTGDAPRLLDLAAYCAGLESVTRATPSTPVDAAVPARPLFEATVTSSPLDGAATAILIGPATPFGPAREGRELWRIDYTARGGAPGELWLAAEYRHRQPVSFSFTPPAGAAAHRVTLAGSFNGWNPGSHPLVGPDAAGRFTLESYEVTPGARYKFVVDGNWQPDPANPRRESDGMGGVNSIVPGVAVAAAEPPALRPVGVGAATAADHAAFQLLGARVAEQGVPEPGGPEPLAIKGAVLLGGNRVLGRWPATTARVDLVAMDFDGERRTFELGGLGAADAVAPDGELRLMVTADSDAATTAPRWVDAVLHRAPARALAPEWRGRTIYFAFTDRFADGQPANDKPLPVPAGAGELHPLAQYQGGDWAGLRQKIEAGYFDQLGVGALWISAPNRQPEWAKRESVPPHNWYTGYHGYWPDSPTETNPHFGTLAELQALVSAAHAHGMLVLLDLVANHVDEDHPWFREHPEWFSPLKLPDGRDNIRLFDEQPFSTWFETFLPGFDYEHSPRAVEAVTDNAVWWIEQTGIDGFRQDAVKHIEPVLWRTLTRKLRERVELPQGRRLYQVGETISGYNTINAFVGADLLDGQFDFPLYWTLRDALAARGKSMRDVAAALRESAAQYPPEALMSPLIGNHDFARFMAYADGDLRTDGSIDDKAEGWKGTIKVDRPEAYQRLRLAQALLHALPGLPMIYYGDEIGLTGGGDPDNRRLLRFDDALTSGEAATLAWVREAGQARRASVALRAGDYQELWADDEHLVFARVCVGRAEGGQTVIVAFNRAESASATSWEVPLPPNLRGARDVKRLFPSRGVASAELAGDTLRLTLPPASGAYFELQ